MARVAHCNLLLQASFLPLPECNPVEAPMSKSNMWTSDTVTECEDSVVMGNSSVPAAGLLSSC